MQKYEIQPKYRVNIQENYQKQTIINKNLHELIKNV